MNSLESISIKSNSAALKTNSTGQAAQPKQTVAAPDGNEQTGQFKALSEDAARVTLEQAVEQLNTAGSSLSPALQFEVNDETDVVVIKVINRSTGEVIRELPPEAVVEAATRGDGGLPQLVQASA